VIKGTRMKALRLLAASAAICASAAALAQSATIGGVLPPPIRGPGSGSLYPTPIPSQGGMRGFHGVPGFHGSHRGINGNVFIYSEPEYYPVVVEEVVHDEPAAPPPAPPPAPRKPYVLGRTYDSLPGGCMKLLQDGASYYHCSGEWYRQVGSQYKAVRMP
jgi:hypothetical protein